LEDRQGLLEAVVFSGGEPTLHTELAAAMQEVRTRGFLVGLHTAGIFPERLRHLLQWADWVGLDIKAPLDQRYSQLTGDNLGASKVLASLKILQSSSVPFLLRTTVASDLEGEIQYKAVCGQLRQLGAPMPEKQLLRSPKYSLPH
jgi:pyruvate formate lyase activating enzyme